MSVLNTILAVVLASLGFYSTIISTTLTAASCVAPSSKLGFCDITWNVSNVTFSKQDERLQEINSTLATITTLSVTPECLTSIRGVLCASAFPNCNNTSSRPAQELCGAVKSNCTEIVARAFGSPNCSSISPYNESVCLDVNVTSDGYCPHYVTYKVPARHLKRFLDQAYKANRTFNETSAQAGNISISCINEYKKLNCRSFVSSCPNSSNITNETCENSLQCLSANSTLNRTAVCSKFASENTTIPTASPTSGYNASAVFNTTLTIRLGSILYDKNFANKSSVVYVKLKANLTDALNKAYANLSGFHGVDILELTCGQDVAVKHIVITESTTEQTLIEEKLRQANTTTGFLHKRIISTNKPCETEKEDDSGSGNNWVYMIVFVCVTALLLLAMVLCNQ